MLTFRAASVSDLSSADPPAVDYFGVAPPGTTVTATSAYGTASTQSGLDTQWSLHLELPNAPVGQRIKVVLSAPPLPSLTFNFTHTAGADRRRTATFDARRARRLTRMPDVRARPFPHAAVATPHYLASAAGLAVLASGGNAVDAIVAANLTLGVVTPYLCGYGGDLFAIVWDGAAERLPRVWSLGRRRRRVSGSATATASACRSSAPTP